MNYRISLGFGCGEDRNGNAIPADHATHCIAEVLKLAAQIYGGASLSDVDGAWINPEGKLVVEKGKSLVIVVDDLLKAGYDRIDPIVQLLKSEAGLNQHSVLWTVSSLARGENV